MSTGTGSNMVVENFRGCMNQTCSSAYQYETCTTLANQDSVFIFEIQLSKYAFFVLRILSTISYFHIHNLLFFSFLYLIHASFSFQGIIAQITIFKFCFLIDTK